MRMVIISPRTSKESGRIVPVNFEPMGACYVSSYVKKHGHECRVIHQLDTPDDDLLEQVKQYKPDVVGFSTWTYNYEKGRELARRIKREYRDVPTIFGGDHPSACPEITKDEGVDFVVKGEGEITTVELLDALELNRSFKSIDGIAYLDNGNVHLTQRRKRIQNLDELPFPDRTNLPMDRYRAKKGGAPVYPMGQKLGTQHTSRGCRYRCYFCATPLTWGREWKARSARNVIDETEELINTHQITRIFFTDEDFMNDTERIYAICDEVKKRKLDFTWYCFARVTDVNEDILKCMKDAGCTEVFYGIESCNDCTLKNLHKGISLKRISQALHLTQKVGLNAWGTYMTGYPWEDETTLLSSLETLKELPVDYLYITFLTPFPGTELYDYCKQKDLLLTQDFSSFDCTKPTIKTPVPTDRLKEIYSIFRYEFYSNPNYISRMLEKIKREPKLIEVYKRFFEEIANNDSSKHKTK